MHLAKLRNLNIERLDVDEAVELITVGRQCVATYATYQVSAPEWLKDSIVQLDGEIKRRHRDMLEARRRELVAAQKSLRTREERRADIDKELDNLNATLGVTSTTVP